MQRSDTQLTCDVNARALRGRLLRDIVCFFSLTFPAIAAAIYNPIRPEKKSRQTTRATIKMLAVAQSLNRAEAAVMRRSGRLPLEGGGGLGMRRARMVEVTRSRAGPTPSSSRRNPQDPFHRIASPSTACSGPVQDEGLSH